MYSTVKRLLIGSPLASDEFGEQRLTKRVALAVFGTDAVASTAFATQEILVVLVPVGRHGGPRLPRPDLAGRHRCCW